MAGATTTPSEHTCIVESCHAIESRITQATEILQARGGQPNLAAAVRGFLLPAQRLRTRWNVRPSNSSNTRQQKVERILRVGNLPVPWPSGHLLASSRPQVVQVRSCDAATKPCDTSRLISLGPAPSWNDIRNIYFASKGFSKSTGRTHKTRISSRGGRGFLCRGFCYYRQFLYSMYEKSRWRAYLYVRWRTYLFVSVHIIVGLFWHSAECWCGRACGDTLEEPLLRTSRPYWLIYETGKRCIGWMCSENMLHFHKWDSAMRNTTSRSHVRLIELASNLPA